MIGNCISCNETTSDCLKPLTNGSSVKCEHGNQNRCYTKLYGKFLLIIVIKLHSITNSFKILRKWIYSERMF